MNNWYLYRLQNYYIIIIVNFPIFPNYYTIFALVMKNAFIYDDVQLAPSQQISIHTQDEWELSYIMCGRGTKFLGEESQPFSEGEVILIPPQYPHGWFFDNETTDDDGHIHNITLRFASDLPSRLSVVLTELEPAVSVLNAIDRPRRYAGKISAQIARSLEDMRTLNSAARLPVIMQLLILIAEKTEPAEIGCKPMNKTARNAERFRIYCECNFYGNITLGKTASYMNMNKSALCKFVKKQTGKTFTEYINSLRLEKAALLLTSTTDAACDIAYDCGFSSIPYFHRLFARYYGMSPYRYRKYNRL